MSSLCRGHAIANSLYRSNVIPEGKNYVWYMGSFYDELLHFVELAGIRTVSARHSRHLM